jgi:hypothetical protein
VLPSPAELFKVLLEADTDIIEVAPGGVIVGPVDVDRQEQGCILLAEAGITRSERYTPTLRSQITARATAGSIEHAERIANAVYETLHGRGRTVIRQPSVDREFLVHFIHVIGGPTLAVGDNLEVWEHILTVESLIGTDPI